MKYYQFSAGNDERFPATRCPEVIEKLLSAGKAVDWPSVEISSKQDVKAVGRKKPVASFLETGARSCIAVNKDIWDTFEPFIRDHARSFELTVWSNKKAYSYIAVYPAKSYYALHLGLEDGERIWTQHFVVSREELENLSPDLIWSGGYWICSQSIYDYCTTNECVNVAFDTLIFR